MCAQHFSKLSVQRTSLAPTVRAKTQIQILKLEQNVPKRTVKIISVHIWKYNSLHDLFFTVHANVFAKTLPQFAIESNTS